MQKKKGISLIVLVITIIVMIVLAGAIILSLNNAGIIEKSNQAVKATDEATVKELAQMAWAEAYADEVRKVEDEGTKKGFQTRVTEALTQNKIDITKYLLNVTTKGVTVKLLTEAWVQDGLKVRRGTEELIIGQDINYDETKAGTTFVEKDVSWKVLGADDDGNLLIMSAEDVKSDYSLDSNNFSEAQKEWLSGAVSKLNSMCVPYGKGEGAISARCITVEDVNKVTGYNPNTALYDNGTITQYGNEVTYYYDSSTTPKYTSVVTGGTPLELTVAHSDGFYWYDESGFHKATVAELENPENAGKKIATLTNSIYFYYGTTLTDNPNGEVKGLATDTEAYKMIFGTNESYNKYWLASQSIYTGSDGLTFNMMRVAGGNIANSRMWFSNGEFQVPIRGVRAVVTLSSDILLDNLK